MSETNIFIFREKRPPAPKLPAFDQLVEEVKSAREQPPEIPPAERKKEVWKVAMKYDPRSVYIPSPGATRFKGIGSVVASIDATLAIPDKKMQERTLEKLLNMYLLRPPAKS